MPRLFLSSCLLVLALASVTSVAQADTWILVTDGSEQPESLLPEDTMAIVDGLEEQGHTVVFVGVGVDKKKRVKIVDLTKVLEEDEAEARMEVWAKRLKRAKIHDEAGTSVLDALATAARIAPPDEPVSVLLLGAFLGEPTPTEDGATDDAAPEDAEPGEDALALWADRGVPGDRLLASHYVTAKARARLERARGYVAQGWILWETPTVTSTPRPWTPFGTLRDGKVRREPASMEATLTIAAAGLAVGDAPRKPSPLAVLRLDDESMRGWLAPTPDGVDLSAPYTASRSLDVTFEWAVGGDALVVPLTDAPATHDVAFGEPIADFVWRDAEGPLASPRVALAEPGEVVLVLRHSNPKALASLEHLEETSPRTVSFEASAPIAAGPYADQVIRVGWAPSKTTALQRATVTLRASTATATEDVAVVARAAPAAVALVPGEAPAAFRLPQGTTKARAAFTVRRLNAFVPAEVAMKATWELPADSPTPALDLSLPDGTTRRIEAGKPFMAPVGQELALAPRLVKPADWARLHPGTVQITVVPAGVLKIEGSMTLTLEPRRPSLRVEPKHARVRVKDGVPHLEHPWILTLENDEGEGAWLLELMKATPTIAALDEAPLAWVITPESPGRWRIEPEGDWAGERPGAFDDATFETRLDVRWPHGDAPRGLPVTIEVPARWGARGWIFVALAALALALAVFTFLKLRAPPVAGTLLYTVEGLEATVGRLDLAPVGGRATALRADRRGKLSLGTTGEAIALLRPTRVGGMLEIESEDGTGVERRLLVDGLTVQTGKHTLRYLSGQPDPEDMERPLIEVPDLLGPDFDMEGGTFDDTLGGSPGSS